MQRHICSTKLSRGYHCRWYSREITIPILLACAATACESSGRAAQLEQPPAYVLADSLVVIIGGQDERPEYQLQYVTGALRLSDGRIVIVDAGFRNIRYFDSDGQHLRTVGRSGDGPGEFRSPRSVSRIRGDTVAVWDAILRRASYFDQSGRFLRTVALNGWARVRDEYANPPLSLAAVYATRSGRLVAESAPYRDPRRYNDATIVRDTVPLLLFDASGEVERLISRVAASDYFFHRSSASRLRYGNRLLIAPADDYLWIGSSGESVIRAIGLRGDKLMTITVPFARRPVRREDVPPRETGILADFIKHMPVPDSLPYYSGLRVGAEGRPWVQRYVAPTDEWQEWFALGRKGEVVARLKLDPRFEVLDIGSDYVIGLLLDNLDVPAVHVRGFRRDDAPLPQSEG